MTSIEKHFLKDISGAYDEEDNFEPQFNVKQSKQNSWESLNFLYSQTTNDSDYNIQKQTQSTLGSNGSIIYRPISLKKYLSPYQRDNCEIQFLGDVKFGGNKQELYQQNQEINEKQNNKNERKSQKQNQVKKQLLMIENDYINSLKGDKNEIQQNLANYQNNLENKNSGENMENSNLNNQIWFSSASEISENSNKNSNRQKNIQQFSSFSSSQNVEEYSDFDFNIDE
ncbi:hypothetical protein PPERSA_01502 [Pseudocohnilembus persalinus]|uniref:Uncharacterized protein n=1 Tax=Pseudocohnilembus persalinus TaxID=266149 RepID=A0A0V0QHA3_PSEPJ|nr:hypothetical protein PPERSA_01502 [Pseudocohnilembus persalinus]|eukprot:KRX01599.1 hypothetical protein PPERSA_01502 [Pseudocohnilembus persalinus]